VDFNANKTVNVDFTRKHKHFPEIQFGHGGEMINQQNSHIHLGLHFQSDGTWSNHISCIYDKACKRLNILRLLKHTLHRKTLIKIYFAFIRPVLEYGDVVWCNCTKENSELLGKIQIMAARIITGLRVNSSKTNLYNELGWEPLEARRDKHKLILFSKIVNGIAPQYMYDLVTPFLPTDHRYSLRSSGNNYCLPLCPTTSYYNNFIPSTIKLWNDLHTDIKNSPTLSIFKAKLKE
jgi:hypothetical protein